MPHWQTALGAKPLISARIGQLSSGRRVVDCADAFIAPGNGEGPLNVACGHFLYTLKCAKRNVWEYFAGQKQF